VSRSEPTARSRPKATATPDLKKSAAERRQIMRAASRLIGQSESGSTSVQDILDEAGVSTRAFYRQFSSKDDLIVAMYREAAERTDALLSAAVAQAAGPVEALEAWTDHWLGLVYEPRKLARIRVLASAEAQGARGVREARNQTHATSITILTQVLLAGQHAGVYRTAEPQDDARAMQAVVLGLLDSQLFREPVMPWARAREYTLGLFARMLGLDQTGPDGSTRSQLDGAPASRSRISSKPTKRPA
jgi:AcrR family transcriptional regulator